jgi:hypothetical protein
MPGDLDRAIGFAPSEHPAKEYDPFDDRRN